VCSERHSEQSDRATERQSEFEKERRRWAGGGGQKDDARRDEAGREERRMHAGAPFPADGVGGDLGGDQRITMAVCVVGIAGLAVRFPGNGLLD